MTTTAEAEPLPVAPDRLFRVPADVYRGMVEHGLLAGADGVELRDGLIVCGSNGGAAADPLDRLYRMPLDVYDRAVELGLLGPDDKVVLLDGLLVNKMGRNPPHVVSAYLTAHALERAVPPGWFVKKEDPVALPTGALRRDSEPEPDVAVVRGTIYDYQSRHPGPPDTALLVEVADSSLSEDRKGLGRYARAGIPVAWIVNVNARTVEVFSDPTGPVEPARYQEAVTFGEGDTVPVVLDGQEVGRIAVRDLLPRV
jgi:Uma2 family endonuclease